MRFKIIDLEQGSESWKKWRRFKVGASDMGAVMGDSPYQTPLSLWELNISGEGKEETAAMQFGKSIEPVARDWINKQYKVHYSPICAESTLYPHLICFDGS